MKEYLRVHKPVMVKEALKYLSPVAGGRFIDATIGAGGHGGAILERILPGGLLIGLDRDRRMLTLARDVLTKSGFPEEAWKLYPLSYAEMEKAVDASGLAGVGFHGILFDLGVSSLHLDDPQRGFSFSSDGPLDFRFDQSQSLTGSDVVNEWPEAELSRLFRENGNERFSRAIARRICQVRDKTSIQTTRQLAEIVRQAIPPRFRTTRRNPSTLVFQAIRIAVNDELSLLRTGLAKALGFLAPSGVCCVLSYHSGEDRIVKLAFQEAARRNRENPEFELLTKKPALPEQDEIRENIRSRSARLRCIKRIRPENE
ncbi:16S rRNA (cytosine(1402)-N(4))-methyltransferase RsmH [Candidatus Sumerlaeota bacterium]|nr:16S rRNA (cytosine(1402)-N(4))-methyltransferase RsmH [Candidatus Sumerlaeota bacterium]